MTISVVNANAAGRADEFWGRRRVHQFQVTFDSSYPTGGEVASLTSVGVQNPANAQVICSERPVLGSPNKAYLVQYDRANDKLLAFWQKDPAATGGADIPFTEVDSTTDLSALIVDILVIEA